MVTCGTRLFRQWSIEDNQIMNQDHPITAIIFDLGRVLVEIDYSHCALPEIEAFDQDVQNHIHEIVADDLITAFDKEQLEWILDTAELLPEGIPPEQHYEYTVIIQRGEIERKIILYINRLTYPSEYPIKPVPAPPR